MNSLATFSSSKLSSSSFNKYIILTVHEGGGAGALPPGFHHFYSCTRCSGGLPAPQESDHVHREPTGITCQAHPPPVPTSSHPGALH